MILSHTTDPGAIQQQTPINQVPCYQITPDGGGYRRPVMPTPAVYTPNSAPWWVVVRLGESFVHLVKNWATLVFQMNDHLIDWKIKYRMFTPSSCVLPNLGAHHYFIEKSQNITQIWIFEHFLTLTKIIIHFLIFCLGKTCLLIHPPPPFRLNSSVSLKEFYVIFPSHHTWTDYCLKDIAQAYNKTIPKYHIKTLQNYCKMRYK